MMYVFAALVGIAVGALIIYMQNRMT